MAQITYVNKEYLYENGDIPAKNKVQDTDMNEIKNVVNSNETKELLAVTNTAPAQCSTGDKYFNTSTKKIYTATATNTWGATGVAPTENTIYIEFTSQTAYAYDGTTLVSVGGGASGGETLPVGSEIDFDGSVSDIPDGWEEITDPNSYSTSEIKTGKTWINNKPIYRQVFSFTLGSTVPADYAVANMPSNYEQVTLLYAIANISGGNQVPVPISWNNAYDCGIMIQSNRIFLRPTWDAFINATGYIIVEYTKTTD